METTKIELFKGRKIRKLMQKRRSDLLDLVVDFMFSGYLDWWKKWAG